MPMRRSTWVVVAIIAVLAIITAFAVKQTGDTTSATATPTPVPSTSLSPADTTQAAAPVYGKEITVEAPLSNSVISSPVTISGEAANWFFENQFSAILYDANGKQLAEGAVNGQGDWTSGESIPFSGSLTYTTPATATGKIVLKKANPSGLPENDLSVEVPVKFR
jgi:hypothetical protein